jgi:hypothetical protein
MQLQMINNGALSLRSSELIRVQSPRGDKGFGREPLAVYKVRRGPFPSIHPSSTTVAMSTHNYYTKVAASTSYTIPKPEVFLLALSRSCRDSMKYRNTF